MRSHLPIGETLRQDHYGEAGEEFNFEHKFETWHMWKVKEIPQGHTGVQVTEQGLRPAPEKTEPDSSCNVCVSVPFRQCLAHIFICNMHAK